LATLDALARLLGPPHVRAAFFAVYAGRQVRFSKVRGRAPAVLVRIVGADAAERLRAEFAGRWLYVPLGVAAERRARDEEIRARLDAGDSPADVARSHRVVCRLSEAHVRRIAARRER
jgi:hypothetical protein